MSDRPPFPFPGEERRAEAPAPAPFAERVKLFRNPWLWAGLILLGCGAGLVFSINQIMSAILHAAPEVAVPKLEGKSLLEALSIASENKLSLQLDSTDFNENLPAGTVLRQRPAAGMTVRSGRAVKIVISKGGQIVFVPNVTGKAVAEAQSLFATERLQMGAMSEVFSADVARGDVVSQSPAPGTIATKGAMVDIAVSKGLPPEGAPLVPDFIGRQADDAHRWADGNRISVRLIEDEKAVGAAGAVLRQDPPSGQPILEGQELRLTIVPLAGEGRGGRFTYDVPAGMPDVTVKVVARDSTGESDIYEGRHKGGQKVDIPMSIESTTRVRVFVDGVLKDERVMEP